MLTAMVLAATLAGAAPPGSSPAAAQPASQPAATFPAPLAEAIAHYQTVGGYSVTIDSFYGAGEDVIRYFYKRPGWVRMEFIKPHAGALLVYNPKTDRVRLWPFGRNHFELGLSPRNPLIRSPRGQYVNHSDVGALFANTLLLQEKGSTDVLGTELLNGHTVLHLVTTGGPGIAVDGVHRIEMWLDTATWFPLKIISSDTLGAMIETVTMDGLQVDPPMPDALFNP